MNTLPPVNYIMYKGEWCHPSRVPKDYLTSQDAPKSSAIGPTTHFGGSGGIKTPKRIRQSQKPLLNKLEQRLFDHLQCVSRQLLPQSITFRLANGVRYTPDIFCFAWPWFDKLRPVAWEAKGPWFTDDAKVKIKLFAAAYPVILVLLASEDKATGIWTFQEVYP